MQLIFGVIQLSLFCTLLMCYTEYRQADNWYLFSSRTHSRRLILYCQVRICQIYSKLMYCLFQMRSHRHKYKWIRANLVMFSSSMFLIHSLMCFHRQEDNWYHFRAELIQEDSFYVAKKGFARFISNFKLIYCVFRTHSHRHTY